MYPFRISTLLSMTKFLCIAAVLLAMPWGGVAAETKQAPASTPVHTAPVREDFVSQQVSIISTTEAFRKSTVSAEVSGRVEKLHVQEGDFVKKGTPLVSLGSTDTSLRVKGAVAGG